MRIKLIAAGILVAASIGGAGWFLHKPLLVRYQVGRLESDDAAVDRVADLGKMAVPRLLDTLKRDTPATPRAGLALARMLDQWPKDDPRSAQLGEQLAAELDDFSPAGKQAVLKIAEALPACGAKESAVKIVLACLKDSDAACREQAILLAMRPEIGRGEAVAPLLRDDKPEVRRCAMLAVGTLRELVPDEVLLPSLHDPDEDVRGLAEAALRGRGLTDKGVRLARLAGDPSPLKRLEVLKHLPADADLDPRAWLNRLCQDSSPLVRASAARAAMDPTGGFNVDLRDQVRRMAATDPDGTVRQIAEFLIRDSSR